jgi:hypothetical protein
MHVYELGNHVLIQYLNCEKIIEIKKRVDKKRIVRPPIMDKDSCGVLLSLPSTSSPGNGVCQEFPFLRICFLRPWVPITVSGNPGFSILMSVSKQGLEEECFIEISV